MSDKDSTSQSKIEKPTKPPRSIQTQTQEVPVQKGDVSKNSQTGDGANPSSGPDVIKAYLKTLPASPGVYRMIDRHGSVLYVGKAKQLNKRVASYTRMQGHSVRIATMIRATVKMEFIVTGTETEALLLEANLIKRMKPRYNVLLRDDKAFPYILITGDHDAPQLTKHRGSRKKKGEYYGPFAAAGNVTRTINTLQRLFLLRNCTDSTYENRSRPCLLYQIKRCAGPCTGEISLEAYGGLVDQAKDFLSGKSAQLQKKLQKEMEEASANLDFEQAAVFRDRIAALTQIQSSQDINTQSLEEADVFALYEENGQTAVQVFFFRMFQNWGNRVYFPRADKTIDSAEILESFIAQFYDNKPLPKQLIVSHTLPSQQLMMEALSERAERKIEITKPQRGEKQRLIEHAQMNAKEALARKFADQRSQGKLLEELAKMLELPKVPRRVEIYDNSHIQGSNPVGAFVVADHTGFVKSQYRKFNFKPSDELGGDDFAMMREMISRRFKKLKPPQVQQKSAQEGSDAGEGSEDDTCPNWPDLLIIDGGKGQLSSVWEVLDELGITQDDLSVVGVAKGVDRNAGREEIHRRGKRPFMIPQRDQGAYFLQRLRDESHRFVIGAHRTRRKNAMVKNPLDEIDGIGAKRKKALLNHFGSAKAVGTANVKDLQAVNGISKDLAETIYGYFRET